MSKTKAFEGLIKDLRTTQGASLSKEGCLTLANLFEEQRKEIEHLKEYIGQIEHEKQLLYGRLNMIRDLTEKEIK